MGQFGSRTWLGCHGRLLDKPAVPQDRQSAARHPEQDQVIVKHGVPDLRRSASLVGHDLPHRRLPLVVRIPLRSRAGLPYNEAHIPGAHNEREGDAQAGEAVLGGRSLTGRFVPQDEVTRTVSVSGLDT